MPNREPVVIDVLPGQVTITAAQPAEDPNLPRAMFYGMLLLVSLAPLAFGAGEPWAQLLHRVGALALFCLWAVWQTARGELQLGRNPMYLPCAVFALIGTAQFASGLTAYRHDTLSEMLNLGVYGILVLVSGETLNRRRHLRTLAQMLAVFGFGVAVLAILQSFSGTRSIYGLRPVDSISATIYGPYANHNHYAGLMEMLVPLAFGAGGLERKGKRILYYFAGSVMALSIFFSGSRGGMIALVVSVLFGAAMLYRQEQNTRTLFAVASFGFVLATMVVLLGTKDTLKRMVDTRDLHRAQINADAIGMAMHKPILGFGLGTFSTVFPKYQSFSTDSLINHVHNDYLELLVETGMAGVGVFAWMLAGVFRSGFRKMREQADEGGRILTLATLTGITAILVHSLLDFNLHIPANAALFFVLCSAVATPFRRSVQPEPVPEWLDEPRRGRF
jgi:O-antigen ligase